MKITLISLSLIFLTSLAFGVSRVGGGTVADVVSGFSAQVPAQFASIQKINSDSVRLLGAPQFLEIGQATGPQALELHPLKNDFPELGILTRGELAQNRMTQGWQHLKSTNSCIDIYFKSSITAETFITSWGKGSGVVVVISRAPQNSQIVLNFINSFKLDPGACKW